MSWPCRVEMSMHSMRSGGSGRASASCSSRSAWLRVVRSPGPAGGVQAQRVLGVGDGRGHQRALVAALRRADVDLRTAHPAEPRAPRPGVVERRGEQHLLGRRRDVGLRVEPLEHALEVARGAEVLRLLDHEAPLAADAPGAHVEDLHAHLEVVLGDADDVGIGAVVEHDRVLLQCPGERAEPVAVPRGVLVLLPLGGLPHLPLDGAHIRLRLPGEERAQVLDERAVVVGLDPTDARRAALVDVAEQARPPDLLAARRKTPSRQVRIGKTRTSWSRVSRMAQAWA